MENSSEPPKTLAFASMDCDTRTGAWEPFVAAEEAQGVEVECSSKSTNQTSCKTSERDLFIEDVQGLGFDISLDQSALPPLPKLIPTLQKSFLWSNPADIPSEVVGVQFASVFKNPLTKVGGVLRAPQQLQFNEKLLQSPMLVQKLAILNMSAQDVLIESAWMQQDVIALFSSLRRLGFRYATTPNFSVFAGECPLAHRINQKKSMVVGKLLQEAGITPILHVYAINDFHLRAYGEYLATYPELRVVIINCTLQRKTPNEVESIRKVVAYLLSVRPDLRIILQGLNIKDATKFCEFDANLHYMVSTPLYNALVRKENHFVEGELHTLHGSTEGKATLARSNISAYIEYAQNVCKPL